MPAIVRYNSSNTDIYNTDVVSIPYTVSGTLVANVTPSLGPRIYFGVAAKIRAVRIGVSTAPTGASIVVDVNKNGTSLFTNQANRPTIAISSFFGTSSLLDIVDIEAGDYLTIDVDEIGSTVAGSNLVVTIDYTVNPKNFT